MGSIIIERNARGRCGITRNSRNSRYNTKTGRGINKIHYDQMLEYISSSTIRTIPASICARDLEMFMPCEQSMGDRKLRTLDAMHSHSSKQQPERVLYLENWSSALNQPLKNRRSLSGKEMDRRTLCTLLYLLFSPLRYLPTINVD